MDMFLDAQSNYLVYIGRLGDTVGFEALPQGLQAAWGTVGYESCGSPGEVANDPSLGHHFSFYTDFQPQNDIAFEVPFWRPNPIYSRTTVWTMLALEGADQLRQRA